MKDFNQIYTWQVDALFFYMRYVVIAGVAWLVFYQWKPARLLKKKIQYAWPVPARVRREVLFSMITLAIYGLTSFLLFRSYRAGETLIYLDISSHGWIYFGGSMVLMVILHDAYFYWTHRLLHIPWIYRVAHLEHHRSVNPTPWAAFAFHPLEAVISAGIVPLVVFIMPIHPLVIGMFLTWMTLINVMGHLGYEMFPEKFIHSALGKWHNTSTYHNLHHRDARCNYGLYFTFWDRMMGTLK